MPFEVLGSAPLEATVNVRVTRAEKEHIQRAAEAAGLSVSDYARRRFLGRTVLPRADETVLAELRRLGGLLKHVYAETGADTAPTLAELRRAMVAIRERAQT